MDRDCIVVGGGAAGLSAALVLGRARRRTLVVDAGGQSNRPAEGIGGLLGNDGRPPAEFYAIGHAELARYPSVEVRSGEVVAAKQEGGGFLVELAGGERQTSRRLLLATGMDYRRPDVPGIEERWGRSVFHCPFCHGWEVRDRPLGVLDRGSMGARRALLLKVWSDDVTLYANGPAGLDEVDARRLAAAGVPVEEREVLELRGPGDELEALVLAGGGERVCRGLMAPVVLHQRNQLAEMLGPALVPPNALTAGAVAVDAMYRTDVPGLSAAGDVCTQSPSVAEAIAAGQKAAAMLVHGLVAEDHGLPEH
ncbi:MAG: NAD(P)/FAD-dependent oxidoreductase [Acidimicrobiia bacterium]